jgi:hypothetical protein
MTKPLAIPVLALAMMATAQSSHPMKAVGGITADALVKNCRNITLLDKTGNGNALQAGLCSGYIAGFVDGTYIGKVHGHLPIPYCLPPNVTNDELAKVVIKYADQHPEQLHETAPYFIAKALSVTFPCR